MTNIIDELKKNIIEVESWEFLGGPVLPFDVRSMIDKLKKISYSSYLDINKIIINDSIFLLRWNNVTVDEKDGFLIVNEKNKINKFKIPLLNLNLLLIENYSILNPNIVCLNLIIETKKTGETT